MSAAQRSSESTLAQALRTRVAHDGEILVGEHDQDRLVELARACRLCEASLPLGPRPVLSLTPRAPILVVGHAPGTKVHASGVPWDDASGDRLRDWLAVDRTLFYDATRFAIVPAGLCYPGRKGGGDAPPRPECAPRWHPPLLATMERLRLVLLIGAHAQAYYLGRDGHRTLSDRVRAFADGSEGCFPLPHPSPRNRRWLAERPWFETEVLPALRSAVDDALRAA